MREAFGGTYTIQLILIFLAIYIAFIAVALNYAKAFRVKNRIIDIVEQHEGFDFNDTSEGSAQNEIKNYLNRVSYYVKLTNISDNTVNDTYRCYSEGYCIEKVSSTVVNNNIEQSYYKITTYVNIDMQVFRLKFTIPIQGETRRIERISQ